MMLLHEIKNLEARMCLEC